MDSREVDAEVERLTAERGWGSWTEGDQRSVMMLYLVSDREETRRHLLTNIKRLRESLDRLEGMVQSGTPHLNDLGELQQAPAAVEAGVGQFSVARRVLERYLKTYPAKGE